MVVPSGATPRKSVETRSGRIAFVEKGSGPVALFVHGVLLNRYLWRNQIEALSDVRRCIAIDPKQDVSVSANAQMIGEFLDAMQIDRVDLIGNDSGGGIAQIFAALNPG